LKDEEVPSYLVYMNVVSTITGLTWSFIISSILIDLLTMVGIIAKLDSTYLGLTILAVGNALPDSLTVIALSKKGYAVMGITGVYAGYLFKLKANFLDY
jgi:sodium/potassium/calcium exchanger 6